MTEGNQSVRRVTWRHAVVYAMLGIAAGVMSFAGAVLLGVLLAMARFKSITQFARGHYLLCIAMAVLGQYAFCAFFTSDLVTLAQTAAFLVVYGVTWCYQRFRQAA